MNTALPDPDPSTFVPPESTTTASSATGPQRGLVRPIAGRRIGGVCAAIADRYGWDRTVVRLLTVLSVFVPGPQVLAYVIAWAVIPAEREPTA